MHNFIVSFLSHYEAEAVAFCCWCAPFTASLLQRSYFVAKLKRWTELWSCGSKGVPMVQSVCFLHLPSFTYYLLTERVCVK